MAPPTLGRAWVYWPFRLVIAVAAVLVFDQAVFAGQLMAGTFTALASHRENATVSGITVAVGVLAAIPIRWPGRGPSWPMLACLGLFGLIAAQIALGFTRLLALHVPLGVAITLVTVLLAVWAWRPRRRPSEHVAEVSR